jgi:hypothetical protein
LILLNYCERYWHAIRKRIIYDRNAFLEEVSHLVEITNLEENGCQYAVSKFNADVINKISIADIEEFSELNLNNYMKKEFSYGPHYIRDEFVYSLYKDTNLTYLQIEELRKLLKLRDSYNQENEEYMDYYTHCEKEEYDNRIHFLRNKYDIDKYIDFDIYEINKVEALVIEEYEQIKKINVDITNLFDKNITFFDYKSYRNNEITEELFKEKYNLYQEYDDYDVNDKLEYDKPPFIRITNFDINILDYAAKYI